MGQAGWIKRKSPRRREHSGGSEGLGGSLCFFSAEFRKTCPALPRQLPVNQRLHGTQSQVRFTLLYHSEPLIRDTLEPTGASSSEAQACQTLGTVFISALACPLQPGLASLIRDHTAGPCSLMSELREKDAFHFPSKAGGFLSGSSWKPRLLFLIAEAPTEIPLWIPRVLKTPTANEPAWSPAGLGRPDTFLKLHFCVVLFKNLLESSRRSIS